MFNENRTSGIGWYYILSILFHVVLIGVVVYLSIKFKSEIKSIGSRVVVSVVSSIPGPLASVSSLMHPAPVIKKITKKLPVTPIKPHIAAKKVVTKPLHHIIPIIKAPSSMTYPKKVVHHVAKPMQARQPSPVVSSNVYEKLHNRVSLNNAFQKLKHQVTEGSVAGNVHKFQSYINKITPIIYSNFKISISRYLNYKAHVSFQITKSGKIYDIRLTRPSGSSYFNSQAIEAVKASSPLPPPPKSFMSYINSNNDGEGVIINFNPKKLLKE
jgi:TonB family protein